MLVIAGKGPAYEQITANTDCTRVRNGEPLRPGRLLLSVQYDRIVTAEQLADYTAVFNLHFGILPQYRGCYPTKWAIINGDPIGVTFHYMTPGIDEGPVICQWKYPSEGLTDGEAYEKCNMAAVSIWEAYKPRLLDGWLPAGVPQDDSKARYYPRTLPFDGLRRKVPEPLLERAERAYTHPGYPGLM